MLQSKDNNGKILMDKWIKMMKKKNKNRRQRGET